MIRGDSRRVLHLPLTMGDEMKRNGESSKIIVIGSLLAIPLFATDYFHFILKIDIIFTHFFYVPIILANLWWGRKGISVAVFLALQLLVIHISSPIGMVVDSVSEVLRMSAKDIEPVPDLVTESGDSSIDAEYIKGVGKLDGGKLLILLDIEKVLAAA